MSWEAWTLFIVIAVSALANVAMVGKPREPISASTAVMVCCINGLLCWCAIRLGTA